MIFKEKPLFVTGRQPRSWSENEISEAAKDMKPEELQQVSLLRENGGTPFSSTLALLRQNYLTIQRPQKARYLDHHYVPPSYGLFLTLSRLNHSCAPNAALPPSDDDTLTLFAAKDIAAGEEINISYAKKLVTCTTARRHRILGFICDCRACRPGTRFHQLSELRRRLIRGLQLLCSDSDHDNLRQFFRPPIITTNKLRNDAKDYTISIPTQLVYCLLTMALMEEEDLLNPINLASLEGYVLRTAAALGTESNVHLARLSLSQDTWVHKFCMASKLLWRADANDADCVLRLQLNDHLSF